MDDKEYLELFDKVKRLESLPTIQEDPQALEIISSISRQLNLTAETDKIYLNNNSTPTIKVDFNGVILGLSKRASSTLGIPISFIVGKNLIELAPESHHEILRSFLNSCLNAEEAEAQIPLSSNTGLNWYCFKLVSKEDSLTIQVEDISEIKQLEQDFQNQSEFISKILENIPVGIFCRNQNGEFILWNHRCAQMFYKMPSQVLGKSARDIFSNEVAAKITTLDQTIIEERETIEISLTLGEEEHKRIFRMIKTPFVENDNVLMTICIVQDVTEKQQLEEQKRARMMEEEEIRVRKELENMISKSEFVIYNLTVEPVPILSYVSPNIQRISGFSPNELKEKVTVLFHSTSSECNYTLNQIFTELCPEKLTIEYPFKRSDGEEIWLRNEGTIKIRDGVKQLIGFIVDITETKKLEIEKKSAIDATRVKSEFLAHMSHEIRTPINGVLGLNSLLMKTTLNEEQHYYSELIHKSASSLLEIINDILDISKIESGKMSLESRPFRLVKFLSETLEIMGIQAKQKNLDFKVNLGALPDTVRGDSKHLGQIIRNLVNNALKFTKEGYIQVLAEEIDRYDDKVYIQFTIRDTGIGIPKDKLNSIFSSFEQASNSISRQYGGTGLGLSICKKLIEMMNGQISVDSTQEQGTSFKFTIELTMEYNLMETLHNINIDIDELHNTMNNTLRILIVEDNEINQLVLSGLLKKLGNLEITCANNGALGVEKFKQQNFDLVFMDCQMPVMDGFAATRAIREYEAHRKHTPIVAITANAMLSAKEECMNAGMDEYITKPIEEEKLKEIVAAFTDSLPPKTNPPLVEQMDTTSFNASSVLQEVSFDDTNLKALEDPYLVEQVIDAYVSAIIVEMDKLKVAIFSNNIDETCFILHSIQGLSGNIGSTGVYTEAKELSQLVKSRGCSEAKEQFEELYETVHKYNKHIKSILPSLIGK